MRTRWSMGILWAFWLVAPAVGGEGFDGLRRDDSAPPAIAGEIADVDAEERSFRVGGLTFLVPPDGPSLSALRPGRIAVVHYRPDGDGFRAIRIELITPDDD